MTVRDRATGPQRVPAESLPLIATLQEAMRDRERLLEAGDELAYFLTPHHRGQNHGSGCPGCAALDRWTVVTEGSEP